MSQNDRAVTTPTGTRSSAFTPRRADLVAQLVGRQVYLRPIRLSEYEFVYDIATHPETILRWRHRGSVPPPDRFPQLLSEGILTQFMVARRSDDSPLGLVQAYNVDARNQCVSMAMLVAPAYEKTGWCFEGSLVFIDYLFEAWNFRKIYIESIEWNLAQFWSGEGRVFHVEGCMRDHEFHGGRYWDVYLLAIYRTEWSTIADRFLDKSRRGETA